MAPVVSMYFFIDPMKKYTRPGEPLKDTKNMNLLTEYLRLLATNCAARNVTPKTRERLYEPSIIMPISAY